MSPVEQFLSAMLPRTGSCFIVATFGAQGTPDFRAVHRDFAPDDYAGMIGFGQWATRKGANVYFAVGSFAVAPDGSLRRTQQHSLLHRCLRLDVDCGAGKPYATKRDALQAVAAFCHAHALPNPWLVDSGGGLHVYWPFAQDILTRQWQVLADRLRAACAAAGFHVDTTTTMDAARILRLPGSMNLKHNAPVRLVGVGAVTPIEQLIPRLPKTAYVPSVPAPAAASRGGDELSAGLLPTYWMRDVMRGCPGMQQMLKRGGREVREPLWKATLDFINKSEDTPTGKYALARAMSAQHPGFSEESFAQKWAQVQQQDYHPPTCAKFEELGMGECAACPFRGKIRSPLAIGRTQATAPAVPVQLPPPIPPTAPGAPPLPPAPPVQAVQKGVFLFTGSPTVQVVDGALTKSLGIRNGMPSKLVDITDDQGNKQQVWVPICRYRLVEVERLLSPDGQQAMVALTFDRNTDGMARVELSNKELSDAKLFHNCLLAHGLHVAKKDAAYLQDTFMSDFLSALQRDRAANRIAARCGWTDDYSGFVLGTELFSPTGREHVRPSGAPEEMEAYHEAGNATDWRHAFDIAMSGGPDRQAVLALAIAAPLMVFTGVDGVMLNAYSPESGVGKSTLCDAALSIWGSPNKLRKDFRDTANATFRLASVVGNLPMVVDEFTNVEGKALSDYIYTITQGREKHRLTSDSKLNASALRWCLPTIVTSNNSVHQKLQEYRRDAVAEAARVCELRLRPLTADMETMGRVKMDLLGLRSNYGFLGPQIIQLIMSKPLEEWRKVVGDYVGWWDKHVAKDTSDRFRSAAAALIEIGCAIGSKLGLPFDRRAVVQEVTRQWKTQQIEFEAGKMKPRDFVGRFILDRINEFAILGGSDGNALMNAMPRRVYGEVRGRSKDGKFMPERVIIPMDLLRDYLREQNGNFKALQEWMRVELETRGIVTRMGRLTFLGGLVQQMTVDAVEFTPQIAGNVQLRVAETGVPPVPAPHAGSV